MSTDRTNYVVGPAFHLPWLRLVRLLYIIVLPIVAVASIAGYLLSGTPPIGVPGATLLTVVTVAVHLAFWTARLLGDRALRAEADRVVYARVAADATGDESLAFWGMVTIVGNLALLASLTVLQQQVSGFVDAEERTIPILLPHLWTWAIPIILGLIAAEVAITFVYWRAERWVPVTAVLDVVLAVWEPHVEPPVSFTKRS